MVMKEKGEKKILKIQLQNLSRFNLACKIMNYEFHNLQSK